MGNSISTVLPHGIVGVSQRKHRAEVKQRRTKTHLTHPLYLYLALEGVKWRQVEHRRRKDEMKQALRVRMTSGRL